MEHQELFTTQEVAKELEVSDAYIRVMISNGMAKPARKMGNVWVFDRAEIERLRNRPISRGGRGKKRTVQA